MPSDTAIDPQLQPYGAWYTSPGGFAYHDPASVPAAIEEAEARLQRLRQSPGDEPKIGFLRSAAVQFAVAGVQLVALLAVLLIDHRAGKAAFLQTPIFLGFNALVFLGLGIRMTLFPPSRRPETMFRHYLSFSIGAWRGWARRLLLKSDAESTRLREVLACMSDAKNVRERHAFVNAFPLYWRHAFGSGWGSMRTARFKGIRSVAVAPDVAVVEANLIVRARRRWLILGSQVPLILGTIALVVAVIVMISSRSLPRALPGTFTLLGSTIGIGIFLTTILTVFAFIPKERRTLTLRKILVRVGGQWRIFNGELQGAEEHDVSWLFDARSRPE